MKKSVDMLENKEKSVELKKTTKSSLYMLPVRKFAQKVSMYLNLSKTDIVIITKNNIPTNIIVPLTEDGIDNTQRFIGIYSMMKERSDRITGVKYQNNEEDFSLIHEQYLVFKNMIDAKNQLNKEKAENKISIFGET